MRVLTGGVCKLIDERFRTRNCSARVRWSARPSLELEPPTCGNLCACLELRRDVRSAPRRDRDPREIKTHRRAQSAGAQSALGRKLAEEQVFRPTLRHLADRVATRLRAKSRPGRTVTVRVRFADLRSVSRSITLDAPISATASSAEIAEELVRAALADILVRRSSLCWGSRCRTWKDTGTCNWNSHWGSTMKSAGRAQRQGWRVTADRAIDNIRSRFGWEAVEYGSALGLSRSVPDEFRELAERDV